MTRQWLSGGWRHGVGAVGVDRSPRRMLDRGARGGDPFPSTLGYVPRQVETLPCPDWLKLWSGSLPASQGSQPVHKGQAGAVLIIREDCVPGSVSAPA